MKKFITLLITSFLVLSTQTAFAQFTDVGETFHQKESINWLLNQKVIQGYSDNTFKPENPVNRAEFLKMLYETIGLKGKTATLNFPDVPENEWYTKYVKEAYADGVVKGYDDGYFRPDARINLAEALKIVMNAFFDVDKEFNSAKYSQECENGENWSTDSLLNDNSIAKIDSGQWYWKYLNGAGSACIMSVGYNANGMGGLWMDGYVDRGDMAEMLYRAKTVKDNQNKPFKKVRKPKDLTHKPSARTVEPTEVTEPAKKSATPATTPVANTNSKLISGNNTSIVAAAPVANANAKVIGYKITAKMYDSLQGKTINTPTAMVSKIKKSFEIWESVTDANIKFRYDGLGADSYSNSNAIPSDGRIYIVLNSNNQSSDAGAAGIGGYDGTIPNDYKKGYVFLETKKGLYTMNLKIIIHEIGHALGLNHTATNSSIMSCGTTAWGDKEMYGISELDRTNLIDTWSPNKSSLIYTISGKITNIGANEDNPYVYAVDTTNGRTYSVLANTLKGEYRIPILTPGTYRVFAKPAEAAYFNEPASKSPSWYVSDNVSTNDPYAGKSFTVNSSNRNVKDINFKLINEPVPFNLFWTQEQNINFIPPYTHEHAFLKKGSSTSVELGHGTYNKTISSIEAYGSDPDYKITNVGTRYWEEWNNPSNHTTFNQFTVTADADAKPGDRLIIAKGPTGNIQAGLVGIHIIGSKDPSSIANDLVWTDSLNALGENAWTKDQIEKGFNFSWLDANYWKK